MNDRLLAIPDIPTGAAYLARLPLANPPAAEQQLLRFLDALLADPPPADTLLSLLEQVRVPLCFVEEEMARRYHNKAVPLSDDEEACFQLVLSAWEKMRQAYALCARIAEPMAGDSQFGALIATVLHRCLYYIGMVMLEHFRARRDLPPGIWLELHKYYGMAEKWGIAYTPLEDALESNLQATHCTAAYITLQLIDVASPYSNSVRDLNLIRRWAGMWSPLVSVLPLEDDLEVPPYIIELGKDAPLHPASNSDQIGLDSRRLDTARLGLQLGHMLAQLRQHMTPSQLGLGEETSGHVIKLLEQLSRPWTQAASPRRFRRFATSGSAMLAQGFEAMHFHIAGREFTQADAASSYSRDDFDKIFVFRDQESPNSTLNTYSNLSFPLDTWSVINHSANGFRLARSTAGSRLTHSQLLAICPHDGEHFLLAQASWLMEESDRSLQLGVAVLPGLPQAISIRPADIHNHTQERYIRAFLLPEVAAIHAASSVVVPKNIYQASRIMEMLVDGKISRIRLMHILQRGMDFDRSSFEYL